MDATHEAVFRTLSDLVELHSPSGVEGAVDDYLLRRLEEHGGATRDAAGNIVLRVDGGEPGPLRAVLAQRTRSARS
jgi:putative aminopeptidase FrvX